MNWLTARRTRKRTAPFGATSTTSRSSPSMATLITEEAEVSLSYLQRHPELTATCSARKLRILERTK